MKFDTPTLCFLTVSVLVLAALLPSIHIVIQNFSRKCENGSDRHNHCQKQKDRKLVIGILSAREHFEERQAIRNTWLQDIKLSEFSEEVLYKFVVGNKGCDIHLNSRKNPYSCEKLNFTYDENFYYDSFQLVSLKEDNNIEGSLSWYSFIWNTSVIVRYPVVVKRLGLLEAVTLSEKPVIVQLFDENTEEVVVSAKFSILSPGKVDGRKSDAVNYRYQPVNPVLLPKDYECSLRILIPGNKILQIPAKRKLTLVNNAEGTVDFLPIDEKGFYTQMETENGVFVGNLVISLNDLDRFKTLQESQQKLDEEYKSFQNVVSHKLDMEGNTHKDILFVNITDTYRNLPLKLLYFHKWVQSEIDVQFVMKTDDDCFVSVDSILAELSSLPKQTKVWWGNFRDNWFVERFGKWAEKYYRASEYPSFACGSGNVVSKDISIWLARNIGILFPYQGEDTSMGIWLSALGPSYVENKGCFCEKGCEKNALVIPQLSVGELHGLWKNKLKCGNICGCD